MDDSKKRYDNTKSSLDEGLIINTIMNNSHDTIYFKDIKSIFLLSSKAHAMQFGFENPLDIVGKSDFDFFPDSFARQAYEDEQNIIFSGEPLIGRVEKWEKPDGTTTWLSASKHPLFDYDGKIIGTWGTSRDITPLKRAEEELAKVNQKLVKVNRKLEELSVIDSLSGLYNHRHFYEELKKTFDLYIRQKQKGNTNSFSVAFLDIDNFKSINDTYGHLVGDLAIKHIADIMIKHTRSIDGCFRYGGDEFAIILSDTNLEVAKGIAEKLRKIIESSPVFLEDMTVLITVSIGVACYSESDSMKDLIQKTDDKLYQSKNEGRNKVS
ncbi:MAG: hypothetical protein CVU84_09755 [Firmicutes bacterium HGW-Firmicutes-1]|jgi:diguanylate cyclase (GGDEF)-like protein/PAS domain S-box-containing protein|nr:MAG: hypothetical protein CVU84_09755 [Firmicutes bacterium HGW-Firmicutes-1]